MKEQHKIWQKEWRQILGEPTDVDIDVDSDFTLHFDLWQPENKQHFFQFFENFPKGKEIAERAYQLRWGAPDELDEKLNDEQILEEINRAIDILQQLQPMEELNSPEITFEKGNDDLRMELLSSADSISIEVDDEFSTFVKNETGKLGYEAYFFLSEPMYRLQSSYTPSHWILWSLTGLEELNPYTPLLKLSNNNCDVAITENGVLVFQLIDEKS